MVIIIEWHEILGVILALIVGVLLIKYADKLSEETIESWGGAFGIKPSKRAILISHRIGGVLFILWGINLLFTEILR